jgi:hypothetical protein
MSASAARIAVMQAAQDGHRSNGPSFRRLYGPWIGRVLLQGQMGPGREKVSGPFLEKGPDTNGT